MWVRLSVALVVSSVILLCLQPVAHSDNATAARRAIQADYDQMDASAARKDINGVVGYDAPNYVIVGPHGNIGRSEQVHYTALIFKTARSLYGHSVIQNFLLQGDTATVVVRRLEEFTMITFDPQTGTHDHFVYDILPQEKWSRGHSRWLRTISKRLSNKVKLNGILLIRKKPDVT